MKWETLLSARRMRANKGYTKRSTDLRSEFEKDYHRIIGSASFRRLQDKTQVFPLDKSDFVRTRLTHSLEVSSFGKSLGQNIGENILKHRPNAGFTSQMKEDICHILQCAGLIHDIGNPPFGHFGETAIREWFKQHLQELTFQDSEGGEERPIVQILEPQMLADLYQFEGNAQALRLVSKLHHLVDENGMNLTYALLNTIVKYPVSSLAVNPASGNIKDKKIGYYYAEEELFQQISQATGAGEKRHPLTYILEAADDLAYKTADIEDAFVKGYVTYPMLTEALGALPENPKFDALERLTSLYDRAKVRKEKDPESYAVKNWIIRAQGFIISCVTYSFTYHYDQIMEGEYTRDLFYDTYCQPLMDLLGQIACKHVFSSEEIYHHEVNEAVILDFLMDKLVRAVLYYETWRKPNAIDKRLLSFISDNYCTAYRHQAAGKSETEKLYLRLLLVTDYVCGMTDSYALRLYRELNGIV